MCDTHLHFFSFRNDLSSSLCTLDLKLNTVNHNHLYISTDAGIILHSTRFGTQKTVPRCYMSDDSTPCVVTSLDLHPFGHPVLLVIFSISCNRFYIHMEKMLKLSEDWVLEWPILVLLLLYSLMENSLNLNSVYYYIFRNLSMIAYIIEIQNGKF